MQPKIIEKYFFFGLLFATFVFTFFIFQPFWIVLVLGASFSMILFPVYKWLNKKLPTTWLASILTLLFFIIVLCVPLFSIGSIVFNQSQNLYHSVVNNGNVIPFINSLGTKINHILPKGASFNINQQVSIFISFLTNNIANIFSTTLSVLFSFILLLLTIFYFLKDGEKWKEAMLKLSPLSNTADQKIINRFTQTISGVLKGYLLVAFIQGTLMGIGLAIFHVPNPAIWAVVAGIASIIPPLGTAVVSVPAIIFLFIIGNIPGAIGLLIWAVLVVGMGDNVLNPYIVGRKINIPPFLILFSVLGGIALLGPVGILIGPLTVSLLYALTEIYQDEFKSDSSKA
ncbi:MAG: AI-2E family transporter [Candidatus Pacebacteria bacterium]|nr:AI-2E family transporter [Candidatus Paceibacterota bacterium]